MIAVCIATYNHEPYIAQAIESVLRQECEEEVRIYIGDDASTDGTRAVCEQYAAQDERIVYIRRPKNVGLSANTIFVHTAAEGQGDETIPTGDMSQCYDRSGARQTNSTVLFRASLLHEADLAEIEQQGFPVLDYPLYGIFSQHTQFGYLPIATAVWREHISVSRPSSVGAQIRYKKERIRIWHWLDKKYNGHFHFRWYRAILWYLWQIFYILFA